MNSLAGKCGPQCLAGQRDPDHAWPGELFKMMADVDLVAVPAPHTAAVRPLRARFLECCFRAIMAAWHHGSRVKATD
jgi:hypothetical protein